MLKNQDVLRSNLKEYTLGIALVIIIILFQILTNGILLKPQNVTNLLLQNSYVLILAMGMLLCILSGGNIDLSVGSIVAFIGAVSATLIVNNNIGVIPGILIALSIGLVIGAWQGFWIAVVGIPSFIVTLAGMLTFRGLTLVILNGRTIGPFPVSYQVLSSGFIPDIVASSDIHILSIIIGIVISIIFIIKEVYDEKQKKLYGVHSKSNNTLILKLVAGVALINIFIYVLASYKGISVIMIILFVLYFTYSFITKKSVFGRHIYAMGGNVKAAKLSGIKTNKVLFFVYVNMALLSALAGIVIAGRLNAASPKAGVGFELDAIAACFIGGASTSGGIGTVMGVVVGALIMGVLNNGMSIMGVSVDWQQAIKGIVLLIAVAFDILSKKKSK
ncbi:MAG: ABC transporter permease [Firmicutes bacterium HGW-Firmicutes-7]|nr:MAG: ABC transporter permease [Firmicutes bacterium HGW-Firmicutes-7]